MTPSSLAMALVLSAVVPGKAMPPSASEETFERQVRPVLVEHCQSCHGAKKQMGGLRLDSREAMLRGGDSGPAVKPGDPDGSRLVRAVEHVGELKMPPKKKLPSPAVEALRAWVKAGAPWPSSARVETDREAWKRHWAYRPVRRAAVPTVQDGKRARTRIDRFLLARLEEKGLSFSEEADRKTLIRRLSYDLLGLPPDAEEVERFVKDPRPDAYERLVETYLASPRYGERWGRYWLDVARYADTKGYVFFEETDYPWGWTYRDYVVEALNEDKPYDRFLLEQLAADQLDLGEDRRPLRGLGFLVLGGRFMNNVHDILDDRIDVVTRGLMGLTVSCARCHDHKFDPIPTEDYYSLYGVFASSVEPTVPPLYSPPPETARYASFQKELAKREKHLEDFLSEKFDALRRGARTRAGEYLLAAHARRGQPRADDFMLLADGNDLNPTMLLRWQSYLEQTARSPHRVWGAWHAFAALPEAEFASQAESLAARLREDAKVNPLVARMFVCPPETLAEVARRYGALLTEVDQHWQQEQSRDSGCRALDDAACEEVRQVLYGEEAPANLRREQISNLELLPDRPAQAELQKRQREVEQWRATGPGAPPRANVLLDLSRPVEPVVFRRGNPTRPGERVPRRVPALLADGERQAFERGSGRLELARTIADPKNPLTARVMVNRLWLHHFGAGLVLTPGDFGLRAAPPSHPELLDWLAAEFVEEGWSVKRMHREIVHSAAYRQVSNDRATGRRVDPENTLLWRMNRRALDLEALRDSLLVVAGELDSTVGGPSVKDALQPGSRRRTLYSWVDRLYVPGLFRTFDFPSPDATSPARDRTLVPQQALFLMNSPLALHAAKKLAERPEVQGSVEERIQKMYRICFSRDADREELTMNSGFVSTPGGGWTRLAQAILLSNEFVFVD